MLIGIEGIRPSRLQRRVSRHTKPSGGAVGERRATALAGPCGGDAGSGDGPLIRIHAIAILGAVLIDVQTPGE